MYGGVMKRETLIHICIRFDTEMNRPIENKIRFNGEMEVLQKAV